MITIYDHYYEIKIMLNMKYKCQLQDFIAIILDILKTIQSESCTCIWISKIIWNSLLASAYSHSL